MNMSGFDNKIILHHILLITFATRFSEFATIFFLYIDTNLIYMFYINVHSEKQRRNLFSKPKIIFFRFATKPIVHNVDGSASSCK